MIWSSNSLFFSHPDIYGICFDSRKIKPGDLFIALKGKNYDGHDFVEEALEKGAVCALVERKICSNNIIVDSCLDSFVRIAKLRRSLFKGITVGVTGSVGKTTLRNSLVNSLSKFYKVQSSISNYNTLIGLSHFLSQFDLNCDFIILELGIENLGEMSPISSLSLPDYSILTNISSAHAYGLGSLFSILKEKSIIFNYTKLGAIFCNQTWYTNFLLNLIKNLNLSYCLFEYNYDSTCLLKNAGKCLFSQLNIKQNFSITKTEGRMNKKFFEINGFSVCLFDSSYNANIASMIHDLKFFKNFSNRKKIVILGDMFGYSVRHHEFLSIYCKTFYQCLLVGENMYFLSQILENCVFFDGFEDLFQYLSQFLNNLNFDCDFLVKGSNFMHLNVVVDFFDKNF